MSVERHTFIVRLSTDDDPMSGQSRWRGTVQHVLSREERSVQTVDDVQRFIEDVLSGRQPPVESS